MGHDKDEVTPLQLFRWCRRAVNWECSHEASRLIDRKTETYWGRWIYSPVRKLHFFHQSKKKKKCNGWKQVLTKLCSPWSKRTFASKVSELKIISSRASISLVPFAVPLVKIQTEDASSLKGTVWSRFLSELVSLSGGIRSAMSVCKMAPAGTSCNDLDLPAITSARWLITVSVENIRLLIKSTLRDPS